MMLFILHKYSPRFLLPTIALVFLLLPAVPAFAADIEVNDTCSLENAVASANTNSATRTMSSRTTSSARAAPHAWRIN